MSEQLQTALEALRIAITFALLLPFVGYGVARLTIPDDWRQFAAILYPITGWCVLVLGMFVANIFLPARIGVIAVILAAGLANAVSLKRAPQRSNVPQEGLLALAAGAALILVALAPHVVQASLGLLSLNSDEEVYYPAINYVLDYPVVGGPHSLSEQFLEGIAVYGWAFQYTAAAVSALTGSLPFHVYPIVTNCLLGLSVPAWYLFFRTVYGAGKGAALLGSALYAAVGLPLWFAFHGYGPQMASLVAIPFSTAACLAAFKQGGARRLLIAGISVAAGLAAYYRGIGLQYLFTVAPVVLLLVWRGRSLLPLARTGAVAGIALVAGLPSHWHVANWYFFQGAIRQVEDIGGNWSEGWGILDFVPIPVGLGTDAYELVHDIYGTGPLAFLDPVLTPFVWPLTAAILAVSVLGLARSPHRAQAALIVAGFVAYMLLNMLVLNFKYGYFKLFAVLAPLVYGLFAMGIAGLWQAKSPGLPLLPKLRAAWPAVGGTLLCAVALFLAYNSYETVFYAARGWGVSMPRSTATDLHQMAELVEPGARVFVAGRFSYPVPPQRLQLRQDHRFGLKKPEDVEIVWARRARGIAMSEMPQADAYGWFDTQQVWRKYHRLRDAEDYDYYLLGPENDPRLEGLGDEDLVWTDGVMSLYRTRGSVRQTPWGIWKERGSLAFSPTSPLMLWASLGGLAATPQAEEPGGPPESGRVRLGILALDSGTATVRMGDAARQIRLEPGITWYTTPTAEMPAKLVVTPDDERQVGIVSLRVLGSGDEEKELVPASVIKDDVYASSTVLRLEHWLKDPFRGKGPGSQ